MSHLKPVVLIILDGWGYKDSPQYNAIAAANTPQWREWWQTCPHLLLQAAGEAVGLPTGQMGNSEVGHMHIGAGRLVLQDLTFIHQAIHNGDFDQNLVLRRAIKNMRDSHHAIHVMGLLSSGGVHSHQEHLFAFLALCAQEDFSNVQLHLFLDGRDTPPKSAEQSIAALETVLKRHPVATVRSISGRYWAMDRDKRWSRIEPVYTVLTTGQSPASFPTVQAAIDAYYAAEISDEFFPATQIGSPHPMVDGDSVFFFNFRADRAVQLTQAFIAPDFKGFTRPAPLQLAGFITMTAYDPHLPATAVFPPRSLKKTLGEVVAAEGLRQLRLAETEKYAHVTFFFNGGRMVEFPGEDRILVPSPQIKTYDLAPAMSAAALTGILTEAIASQDYALIVCNYANADMVGHTGDFKATVLAIEAIDRALYEIGKAVQQVSGHLLITADHGNAECMFDAGTAQAHTAHTCEPVPLVYVGDTQHHFRERHASLQDIAPTILALLHIPKPQEMTGQSLWANEDA